MEYTEIMPNAVQFAASMILSGFSFPQVKKLLPKYANTDGNAFIKTVRNLSARHFRKQFIEYLDGNMPRLLTDSEVVTIANEVGVPGGKTKIDNVEKVIEMIKLDVDNPELISASVKVSTKQPVSIEVLTDRVTRLQNGLTRKLASVARNEKRLTVLKQELAVDTENKQLAYQIKNLEYLIDETNISIKKSRTNIDKLNKQIEKAEKLEAVNQQENTENTENQEA